MSNPKRLLLVLSIAILAIGAVSPPALAQESFAAELTEDKVRLIRQNCVSAQVAMQRYQRSDVVARTNRGRAYEATLRLMAALNSRLALNKMNEPRMIEIATELQDTFSSFYRHYTTYENSISAAINTKCVDQPVTFYEQLSKARGHRVQLKEDIDTMQRLIDDYQVQYLALKQKLITPAQPTENE